MVLRLARSAAVAAAIAAGVAPGSASGATTSLGGSPLNVHVGPLGQLQAFRSASPSS
jgi:hypothetical protein